MQRMETPSRRMARNALEHEAVGCEVSRMQHADALRSYVTDRPARRLGGPQDGAAIYDRVTMLCA